MFILQSHSCLDFYIVSVLCKYWVYQFFIVVYLLIFILYTTSGGVLEVKYKILIVDDDVDLLKMLQKFFEMKGYTVVLAKNGAEALEMVTVRPDIILLDINMPQVDGIEVCKRIRDKVMCPIIFLTAKVEEEDRINGLLSGGDDYILKPFSLKELDARIIAHLKREERLRRKTEQRFYGELVIDYASKCVHMKGNPLGLTKLEYEIIEFLSMNPEMVFDKERIYEKISGYDAEGDSRVVIELICRIRKKIKQYTEREYIETIWGWDISGQNKKSLYVKMRLLKIYLQREGGCI